MTEPVIRTRVDSFKGTVDELVTWCVQRDLDPTLVEVTSTHLRFTTPETAEEAERRARYEADHKRRTRKYELRQWQLLQEKYGPDGPREVEESVGDINDL